MISRVDDTEQVYFLWFWDKDIIMAFAQETTVYTTAIKHVLYLYFADER